MNVATLITAHHPDTYAQCTLSLDTLRTGFPTADIQVFANTLVTPDNILLEIERRCKTIGACFMPLEEWTHHADWIQERIEKSPDGCLAIVDPDMIFWENCEGFAFDALIAGMFVPDHWNHWSRSAYRSRLHTSFLWIKDSEALWREIDRVQDEDGYLPCNPYRPVKVFDYGRPTFYDTLAILCHALPRSAMAVFGEEHLNCFDHINSASFFHQMQERWDNDAQRQEFARIHELAKTNPKELRGLWRKTLAYYQQQHVELLKRLQSSNWHGATQAEISGTSTGNHS